MQLCYPDLRCFKTLLVQKRSLLQVLVEGPSKDRDALTGKTASMKRVKFAMKAVSASLAAADRGALLDLSPGDYAAVRITSSSGGSLVAEALARTNVVEFKRTFGAVLPGCLDSRAQRQQGVAAVI